MTSDKTSSHSAMVAEGQDAVKDEEMKWTRFDRTPNSNEVDTRLDRT